MKMSGEIRVRSDKAHRSLYQDYRKYLGKEMHELFYLAVCIGYHEDRHLPLANKSTEDRFWSRTILPDEWATYYAITLQKANMNYDAVRDDAKVMQEMEAYANGGIHYLCDEVLVGGYLIEKDGSLMFDLQVVEDLPRRILQFLFQSIEWTK
jgi:hypothetical protein